LEPVLSSSLNFQRTTSFGYFKNLKKAIVYIKEAVVYIKEAVVYMKESMVLWPVH
jgi:hypothetical protein